jgi:cellobiose phosphorylase
MTSARSIDCAILGSDLRRREPSALAIHVTVQQRLVRENDQLILLFDPPFDKGALDPGYIKGYVPEFARTVGTRTPQMGGAGHCFTGQGERAMKLFG